MPIPLESPALSRLLELVRQTKRYSICEFELGKFEVIDDRYLFDQLLRFPEAAEIKAEMVQRTKWRSCLIGIG